MAVLSLSYGGWVGGAVFVVGVVVGKSVVVVFVFVVCLLLWWSVVHCGVVIVASRLVEVLVSFVVGVCFVLE